MAVRSRTFWALNATSNATTTLYTVPANRVGLVRTWTISNGTAATLVLVAAVKVGGTSFRHWAKSMLAGECLEVPVPVILAEGDAFQIICPTIASGAVATCGYGSLLDGDPS